MSAAALARHLLSLGLTAEQIVTALEINESEQTPATFPRDPMMEKRRAYDRARMKLRRAECSDEEWQLLRVRVFQRDKLTCTYCGETTDDLHCDHILPFSRGGRSVIENLTTACGPCNIANGDRTPEEWRARG